MRTRSRLIRLVPWALSALAVLLGCSRRSHPSSAQPLAASDSASLAADPASSASSAPAVSGHWSEQSFVVRGGFAQLYPKWITITLSDRPKSCDQMQLGASEQALQLTIPSGPKADYFVGHTLAVSLNLHGANAIGTVPAGYAQVHLESFEPVAGKKLRGTVRFSYPTGSETQAPRYQAQGPFEVPLCSALSPTPSMPDLNTDAAPVHGTILGQETSFPSFLAYTRDNGSGGSILLLRGFPRPTDCNAPHPTPYLFGAEIGPESAGTYPLGAPMPVAWALQMRDPQKAERTVYAGDGAGYVKLDSVQLGPQGRVQGCLAAVTVQEDDPKWRFELAGRFEAKLCGPLPISP